MEARVHDCVVVVVVAGEAKHGCHDDSFAKQRIFRGGSIFEYVVEENKDGTLLYLTSGILRWDAGK